MRTAGFGRRGLGQVVEFIVSAGDFEKRLREADCELAEVKFAFLENDGQISLLRK